MFYPNYFHPLKTSETYSSNRSKAARHPDGQVPGRHRHAAGPGGERSQERGEEEGESTTCIRSEAGLYGSTSNCRKTYLRKFYFPIILPLNMAKNLLAECN
jgi:hypothetical protein